MVKMNEKGSYLKAETVKRGTVITFLDEGEWVKSERYTYDDGSPVNQFIIGVKYENEKKSLRMNKASRVAMVEAYGDETKNWVGKQARVIITPTPNGANKMILLVAEQSSKPTPQEQADWDSDL